MLRNQLLQDPEDPARSVTHLTDAVKLSDLKEMELDLVMGASAWDSWLPHGVGTSGGQVTHSALH